MPGAFANRAYQPVFNFGRTFLVVEKRNMLLPRKPQHDVKSTLVSSVEEPARRDSVCANRIKSAGTDVGKVAVYYFRLRVVNTVPVSAKGAVSDAPNEELSIAKRQKFPA